MRFAVAEHLKNKPATIIELLRALPEEDFERMRVENQRALGLARQELERLLVEKQVLEEAASFQEGEPRS